jgi:hypothetical protein
MEIRIEIVGDIVERQELLNGTESVTIEGTDPAGEWTLVGSFSWNLGLVDYAGEGDLTLTRADGELFATLTQASVSAESTGDDTADHSFVTVYEIDGGAGAFADAAGVAGGRGTLAGGTFRGAWVLTLTTP